MREPAWFWIIGGAIGVVGLIGWEDFKQKVNGASDETEGSNGGGGDPIGEPIPDTVRWEYLETVGTDEDGVEYIVQIQRKDIIGRDGPVSTATGRWRPMRSDGRGGYMGIRGETRTRLGFATRQEAYNEALDALNRANADSDPFPEGVDGRGGYETELTAPDSSPSPVDYTDALSNVQIQDVGDQYSTVNTTINTTDLEGAVDAVIP